MQDNNSISSSAHIFVFVEVAINRYNSSARCLIFTFIPKIISFAKVQEQTGSTQIRALHATFTTGQKENLLANGDSFYPPPPP